MLKVTLRILISYWMNAEVTAPDGYAIAERVEFEVLPTGEVQTFETVSYTHLCVGSGHSNP